MMPTRALSHRLPVFGVSASHKPWSLTNNLNHFSAQPHPFLVPKSVIKLHINHYPDDLASKIEVICRRVINSEIHVLATGWNNGCVGESLALRLNYLSSQVRSRKSAFSGEIGSRRLSVIRYTYPYRSINPAKLLDRYHRSDICPLRSSKEGVRFFVGGIRRINLLLHLDQSLIQRFVAAVESFPREPICPPNLLPLQNGKHRIDDECGEAKKLYPKSYILAPIAIFLGWVAACWGWWKVRRSNDGRQAWTGLAIVCVGFLASVAGGITFGIRFLMF